MALCYNPINCLLSVVGLITLLMFGAAIVLMIKNEGFKGTIQYFTNPFGKLMENIGEEDEDKKADKKS